MIFTKEELVDVCRLGDVAGLCGANCRHNYNAFIPGASVRNYSDEELTRMREEEAQVKTWRDKEYNTYEATQK